MASLASVTACPGRGRDPKWAQDFVQAMSTGSWDVTYRDVLVATYRGRRSVLAWVLEDDAVAWGAHAVAADVAAEPTAKADSRPPAPTRCQVHRATAMQRAGGPSRSRGGGCARAAQRRAVFGCPLWERRVPVGIGL